MSNPNEKAFKLVLVKNGISSLLLFLISMGLILLPIVLMATYEIPKEAFYTILITDLLLFFLLFWKFFDRLFIKYESSVSFHPDHFQVDGTQYKWEEIEWVSKNTGSKMVMGFAVGL